MTDKIAPEVCEKEFLRLCAARRISSDEKAMTKEELGTFVENKAKLLRLLATTSLTIGPPPESLPVYTPIDLDADGAVPKPLTFYRATGATLMAQDGHGPYDNVARVTAVATEMTKSTPGALSKLGIEDFRAVTLITNFFFTR